MTTYTYITNDGLLLACADGSARPLDDYDRDLYTFLDGVALANEPYRALHEWQLLEMTRLDKRMTGLAVDLWIDSGETFTRYGSDKCRCIKFPCDMDEGSSNCAPLTICADPKIPSMGGVEIKHTLPSEEFERIRKFVSLNSDLLNRFDNYDVDLCDLIDKMKKV